MKVCVYSYREFDEAFWFKKYSKELGIELVICKDAPSMDNISMAKGCTAISILTSVITPEMIDAFLEQGVGFISTRTIGYEHIDIKYAKKAGMGAGNAVYGPNGVADYAIMLMLMCMRNMKRIMERAVIQDFSLKGLCGRELPDMTVGIIGTGRIGTAVMRNLSGFGCKIMAYDKYGSNEAKNYGTYVALDKLLQESDIISLHMPLTDENHHMIDRQTIAKMKERVILINTARGGLIDSDALIEGIESGKIGAAGLDVVENEFGLYYYDLKSDVLDNRELALLRSFPNVIVTPHMAFYTEDAISDMVKHSLLSCKAHAEGSENPWQL